MTVSDIERRARERIGTTLNGKYRLDALIGLGGMAAVYRASHRNRAQLAVKMLHPDISLNLEVRARFLREGYAANSVQHPGVVLVTDDDIAEDGSAFLVMELLDGASVEELWGHFAHRMPLPVVVDIALQLLDVLAAAHAAGIVHRDIKPANLFVTRGGVVKVLDFGIARVLEGTAAGSSGTAAGLPMGTPTFMAPEQALGRVAEIDARTDVWAVGATMFALLSGETVHVAASAAETLVRAATRPARSLSEVVADIPVGVAHVVDEALAFEPKDRYASADAMAQGLIAATGATATGAAASGRLATLFPPRRSSLPESKPREAPTSEFASAPTMSAPELSSPNAAPLVASADPRGATELPVSSTRPDAPAGRRAAKSRSVAIAAAIGALVVLFGVGLFWRGRTPGKGGAPSPSGSEVASAPSASGSASPPPGGPTFVIVTGSQNLTGEPVLNEALEVVLESALKRSNKLYPYSGATMRALVNEVAPGVSGNDDELGRIVAEKRHARTVMVRLGASPKGTAIATSLVAKDGATGAKIADLMEDAPRLDSMVVTVAKLACQLRAKLGDEPCDAAAESGSGLGASIEANHRFALGRDAFTTGRQKEAATQLQKAVTIDPDFAMAHNILGLTLWNLGRPEEGRENLKTAMALRDRLGKRERLEVTAVYHLFLDEFDQAAEAYAELFRRWPAETKSRGNLAQAYLAMGQFDLAITTLKRTIEEHPKLIHARTELPVMLVIDGKLDDADRESEALLTAFNHPVEESYVCRALVLLEKGNRPDALAMVDKLRELDPSVAAVFEGDWAMSEGRLKDAVTGLKAAIAVDEKANATAYAESKWVMLAEAYARQGDASHAREAARHAAKSNDLEVLFGTARVLARSGAPAEASTLERIIVAHPGMRAPLFGRMVATEVLAAGHTTKDEIIKAMGDPGKGSGSWLAHADLGEALVNLGAYEEAEHELHRAVEARGDGSMVFRDDAPTLRYMPPAKYWLARAKEGLHRADAADAYKAFLASEPAAQGDALAIDAKKRIASLARAK